MSFSPSSMPNVQECVFDETSKILKLTKEGVEKRPRVDFELKLSSLVSPMSILNSWSTFLRPYVGVPCLPLITGNLTVLCQF
jgi:hypothetical protein